MRKAIVFFALLALFSAVAWADDDSEDDNRRAPGSWFKVAVKSGPTPLPRDAIAAQAFDDGIYTFGGFKENLDPTNPIENVFYNDVWRFNTNSNKWSQRTALPDPTTGTFPAPRAYSIAGRYGDEFIVGFGITYRADFTGAKAYNDLWGFNTATNTWRQIRADGNTGGPGARAETNAVVHNGKIYLFGGATQFFSTKGDTWVYDFATNAWTLLTLSPAPSPRYGATTALDTDNERMIIYGGERSVFTASGADFIFSGPDTQWAFDFNTLTWSRITPLSNIPDRNNGNGGVYVNNKFFLFGGDIGGGSACPNAFFIQNNVDETWVWDANINVWTQLCTQVTPPNLKRGVSVAVDNAVYLFGGFAFNTNTCGPFSFPTDVWRYNIRGCYGGIPCARNL